MKKEEIIRITEHMQKDAKEEAKAVRKKEISVPTGLDTNGYKHYCEGWDDALKELLGRIK